MAANEEKSALRREAERLRGLLPAEERQRLSAAICARTAAYLSRQEGRAGWPGVLLAYLPVRSELDLTPLYEWAWEQGLPIAAPRVVPGTKRMQAHRLRSLAETETGRWGLREPRPDCPVAAPAEIGCVLMPGLAFDREGGRLGYGGGYYDRYLAALRLEMGRLPLLIAPAFEVQLLERVPMEEHDIRLDAVLTESALYELTESALYERRHRTREVER
ncbi:5-formyltetrahydrofolate cyclo-ligase [Paenibacillus sp. J31TS4]|uniref:5-formyltetrahydrofolate cyclo-ligase n=1 Tax=Paenibacillus sp. J31TS4 TaxID=2807195 RepID=UPI001B1C3320|nr:5-formyltetrahydrofolate cyclo-ligase [Paenibacillus sp. J31TS4]GIP39982.1 5-formyltetrahydrofolate cyclo-ligase [Paenibacillus sp. J31TS4]